MKISHKHIIYLIFITTNNEKTKLLIELRLADSTQIFAFALRLLRDYSSYIQYYQRKEPFTTSTRPDPDSIQFLTAS